MPGSGADRRIPEVVPPLSLPEFGYGDLEKKKRIGTGGDADVYGATLDHGGSTYPVALKEPRFEGTLRKQVVEQFQAEAETWSRLDDHDNVVTVYAWGTDRLPWLALELMDGGTLGERVGSLDIDEALWLAGRIAEGVRYGHRHGIAHLDIKPSNVLLRDTGDGTWDYPKVSDWGLAKLLLEHSQSVDGLSPTYAAPEQFDTEQYGKTDDITDIYQLGAVVYALLTGEPPFQGSSRAVMQSVLDTDPEPPSERNPALPEAVDDVVLKALAKEKDERYDGVLTFRKHLDRLFEAAIEGGTASGAVSTGSGRGDGESSRRADDGGESASRSGSTVARRGVLGILGLGLVGGGGWFAATQLDGESGGPTATTEPTESFETTVEDPMDTTTTELVAPNGTSLGTSTPPSRVGVVNAVGDVSDREVVSVELTVRPADGTVDLEDLVMEWVTSSGTTRLVAYRGGDPDAETVQGEPNEQAAAFSWISLRDDDASIETDNTLNDQGDRAVITIDIDGEPGLQPLEEGDSVSARLTTGSGMTTDLRLNVPQTLSGSDSVIL